MMDGQVVIDPDAGRNGRHAMVGTAVTTRVGRFWLDAAGIVHVEALPGLEQSRSDAVETIAVSWKVARQRARPTLVDIRGAKGIDREARTYYASAASASAVALLIGSPLTRLIGNVFIGFGKPTLPVRLFTSEAEALAWLQTSLETARLRRDG
jgi:hypothetical protein